MPRKSNSRSSSSTYMEPMEFLKFAKVNRDVTQKRPRKKKKDERPFMTYGLNDKNFKRAKKVNEMLEKEGNIEHYRNKAIERRSKANKKRKSKENRERNSNLRSMQGSHMYGGSRSIFSRNIAGPQNERKYRPKRGNHRDRDSRTKLLRGSRRNRRSRKTHGRKSLPPPPTRPPPPQSPPLPPRSSYDGKLIYVDESTRTRKSLHDIKPPY
jgi:hypothetical protein